jgi:hypothetical protein
MFRRNPVKDQKEPMGRRKLLGGAATVGAAVAAVTLLPGQAPEPKLAAKEATATDDGQSGYRLTEHIRRYYATARV